MKGTREKKCKNDYEVEEKRKTLQNNSFSPCLKNLRCCLDEKKKMSHLWKKHPIVTDHKEEDGAYRERSDVVVKWEMCVSSVCNVIFLYMLLG